MTFTVHFDDGDAEVDLPEAVLESGYVQGFLRCSSVMKDDVITIHTDKVSWEQISPVFEGESVDVLSASEKAFDGFLDLSDYMMVSVTPSVLFGQRTPAEFVRETGLFGEALERLLALEEKGYDPVELHALYESLWNSFHPHHVELLQSRLEGLRKREFGAEIGRCEIARQLARMVFLREASGEEVDFDDLFERVPLHNRAHPLAVPVAERLSEMAKGWNWALRADSIPPGVALSGSALFKILRGEPLGEGSGLDFFITSESEDELFRTYLKAVEFFTAGEECLVTNLGSVTYVYGRGQPVQIILSEYKSILQDCISFDLPFCSSLWMNGTLWVHEVARLAVLKKMVLPSVVMPERKYKLQELFEEGYTFICSPFFSTDPPDYFSPDGSLFAQHLSFAKRGRAYPVELHHKESINKPNPPLVLSLEESFHEFADRILTTFIERGFFNSFPGMPEIYASKSVFKVVNYAKRHGPLDLEYSEATCSLLFGYKKYIKHLLSNEGGASFEKHESRYSYAERCYYAEYAQWTRSLDFLSTEAGDSAEITSLKIRHLPNYPPCGSEKVYLRNLSIDPNPLSSSEKVDARVILRNSRKEGSKLVIPSLPPEAQDLLEELYSKMSYLPEMPIRDAVKQHIIDTSLNVSPKYLQPISRKFRSFLLDDIVVIDNRLTVPFCLEPNVEEGLKAQGYISTD